VDIWAVGTCEARFQMREGIAMDDGRIAWYRGRK